MLKLKSKNSFSIWEVFVLLPQLLQLYKKLFKFYSAAEVEIKMEAGKNRKLTVNIATEIIDAQLVSIKLRRTNCVKSVDTSSISVITYDLTLDLSFRVLFLINFSPDICYRLI